MLLQLDITESQQVCKALPLHRPSRRSIWLLVVKHAGMVSRHVG